MDDDGDDDDDDDSGRECSYKRNNEFAKPLLPWKINKYDIF
jgi:hypothetical protein